LVILLYPIWIAVRNRGRSRSIHARLPAAAELEAGFEIFLEFACEIGAIGEVEPL
jgi:hypothetical protein